jgi:hypothetical protein
MPVIFAVDFDVFREANIGVWYGSDKTCSAQHREIREDVERR